MKVTGKELAFEGNYLKILRKHFETTAGRKSIWETVERKNIYHRGAVVIVAVTREGEVILERNWRVPIESYVIQFPAGLTDKEGESEEEAARRELLEETGYAARELIPIIPAPLCPALATTEANHFFAPEVEFTGEQRRDDVEEIEVLKVPIEKLDEFLMNLPGDTKLDLRVPGILWVLERKNLISK